MGYYIDVLTPSQERLSIEEVRIEAKKYLPDCEVILNEGTEQAWEELIVRINEDDPVCTIGCTPFTKGETDDSDLGWVLWNIEDCEPASAVQWLRKYVPSINTMYRFRFLSRAFNGTDNGLTGALIRWIHDKRGGIIRADNEGYTNEDGHHILWQFSDRASGRWECAVLRDDGSWDSFIMDLGNQDHRAEFKAARVPDGAERFTGRRTEITE